VADNDQIVTNFCHAWTDGDVDAVIDAFAEDALYHNVPRDPIEGRPAIADFIRSFLSGEGSVVFETHHQVCNGNIVMNERIDHISRDGKTTSLPVMGIFHIVDGKIAVWKDYFDLGMFINTS
jgi:limonene-1,2-epoxide hydrolase